MRSKSIISLCLCLLIALSGCAETKQPAAAESTPATVAAVPDAEPQQRLQLSVAGSEDVGFSKELLGGDNFHSLAYFGFSTVDVCLDGTLVPLSDAIRQGKLSTAEILAFARVDAQHGFCTEAYTSERGLTHFTYTYPEYTLRIAYDVYETPDGRQTLIDDLLVANDMHNFSDFYPDPQSEWGDFLDREDWGITFEIVSVTPTQITLKYTQQGGQQLGKLLMEDYTLYGLQNQDASDQSYGYLGRSTPDATGKPLQLSMNASGLIVLDWSEALGTLEPGDYTLRLSITDHYDKSAVHPLIVKYHDKQGYHIAFTVA